MKKYIKELIIILIVAAPAIYLSIKWSLLPNEIIVISNDFDFGYNQSKLSLVLLIMLNVVFYFLMLLVPKFKNKDLADSNRYHNIRLISTFFVTAIISYFIVTAVYAYPRKINALLGFVGLLYAILGNYMPTIKSNRRFGFFTPETQESPNVWRKTHRASGRLMMVFGIILMILSLQDINIFLLLFFMSIMSLIVTSFAHIYSYYALKKEMKTELVTANTKNSNTNPNI